MQASFFIRGIIQAEAGNVVYKGGADTHHSLNDNMPALKESYFFNEETGYFGEKERGNSHVRTIRSSDPLKTAREFYETAAYGGIESPIISDQGLKKGEMVKLADDTFISFREISKSGSPAVEINIAYVDMATGEIKSQKIHFEKE